MTHKKFMDEIQNLKLKIASMIAYADECRTKAIQVLRDTEDLEKRAKEISEDSIVKQSRDFTNYNNN